MERIFFQTWAYISLSSKVNTEPIAIRYHWKATIIELGRYPSNQGEESIFLNGSKYIHHNQGVHIAAFQAIVKTIREFIRKITTHRDHSQSGSCDRSNDLQEPRFESQTTD